MKQRSYRITVEHVSDARGATVSRAPLAFTACNHDDLFAIVEKSRGRGILNDDESAAMTIGLKLLAGIALEHRAEALFDELRAPLGEFVRKLKAIPARSE